LQVPKFGIYVWKRFPGERIDVSAPQKSNDTWAYGCWNLGTRLGRKTEQMRKSRPGLRTENGTRYGISKAR